MQSPTASEVISFAVKLEENSGNFYEELARRWADDRETWNSFSAQNRKNKTAIQRAYYGVISDALEGCFAFAEIDIDHYPINTELPLELGYAESLRKAIEIEDMITAFYLDAARAAKSLLADVPIVFERTARKRNERQLKLTELLNAS
jgi:rubrerythrin